KNIEKYREIAAAAGKVWIKHGALEFVECVADDVKKGKWTSFPQAVQLKASETVFFSYIVYKSRAHRDRVLAKVMKDPYMVAHEADMMPFDGKRMMWGGFEPIVSLKAKAKKKK
ncbi:MAG: DUF1428 domain-containing protein, partial [Proteobacteria bacterium]